jgi:hypothetical protein
MPNYLLLLHADPNIFKNSSPAELQTVFQKYYGWRTHQQEAGSLVSGAKLQDGTGRILRKENDDLTIIDGPFSETKELIGGLFEIRADNYDQAVEIAKTCPHLEYGYIELRQVEGGPK